MISIILLGALSASAFTLGKLALAFTSPVFLIGIRFFMAGLVIGAYYFLRYRKIPTLSTYQWGLLAQVTFFGFFLGPCLVYWALNYLPSNKAALLYSSSPFIAAFFSYLVFKEKMTWKKLVGLCIGILGFIPAIITTESSEQGSALLSKAEIGIILGVAAFAYGWVIMRKLLKSSSAPETFITSFGMTLGGLASIGVAFIIECPCLPYDHLLYFSMLVAGLVLFGNILSYILYIYNLKHYTATVMTFGEMLTSVFAALYGWLLLGETVGLGFFISVTMFLTGLYIFYREEKNLGYFMEP